MSDAKSPQSFLRTARFGLHMQEELVSRWIIQHASSEALAPMTVQILSRLGYRIVSPEGFAEQRAAVPDLMPDLLLVDERRLAEEEFGRDVPIVLLTGRQGATGAEPPIVGAAKKPAGLHELYRLIQQVFEDTPRSTPRIATQLRARCASGGEHWEGRVLSLSENGCLIRSGEEILLGQKLVLELSLPQSESVRLEAEAAYQLLPDTGLVFSAVAPTQREALERFVTGAIVGR